MASIKDRLRTDLTAAMKSRDELRAATLRMALAAVTTEEVSGKQARTLRDEEVVTVLRLEVRKRAEAAEAFGSAGRTDRADRERAEASVLEAYLPAPLSDDELRTLVAAAVGDAGATGPQAMGAVMKIVQPRVAGRADGARVAAEVRRQISG